MYVRCCEFFFRMPIHRTVTQCFLREILTFAIYVTSVFLFLSLGDPSQNGKRTNSTLDSEGTFNSYM